MEDPKLFSVILSWVPMLLLIGVWVYFLKRKSPTQEQQLDLVRRNNELLERIAVALERKNDQ